MQKRCPKFVSHIFRFEFRSDCERRLACELAGQESIPGEEIQMLKK